MTDIGPVKLLAVDGFGRRSSEAQFGEPIAWLWMTAHATPRTGQHHYATLSISPAGTPRELLAHRFQNALDSLAWHVAQA